MLCFRYVLWHVLRMKEKGTGKGTQYIITRVRMRARLIRAKNPHGSRKAGDFP